MRNLFNTQKKTPINPTCLLSAIWRFGTIGTGFLVSTPERNRHPTFEMARLVTKITPPPPKKTPKTKQKNLTAYNLG